MKNKVIIFGIGLVCGLLIRTCSNNQNKVVVVPEQIGGGQTISEIEYRTIESVIELPKWYKDTKKEKELQKEIEVREKMLQQYQSEFEWLQKEFAYLDSIQQAGKYKQAIQPKQFSLLFDDDFLSLDVQGVVTGEIKEYTPFYKIKERTIEIKQPRQKNFSLSAGAGFNVFRGSVGFKHYEFEWINAGGQNYQTFNYRILF